MQGTVVDIKLDFKGDKKIREKDKVTYSLNPNINKRIKSKRIEDLRKQAVDNVKKSMTMLDSKGKVGFFGQQSDSTFRFNQTLVEPPLSVAR